MVQGYTVLVRLGVMASAFALLLFCARAAHAQDDYGLVKLPGAPAASAPGAFATAPQAGAPAGYAPQPAPAYGMSPNSYVAAQPYGAYAPPQQLANSDPGYLPAMSAPPGASGYVLGTGDKIKITVFGEDDLSGEYTVDSQGTIRMPLIGQVQATGMTGPQLENSIGSALANGFLRSPRVSTQITTYRPFYVVGAVNRPGEYPYGINMTALKAISLAGGFQEHAVESTVYVRHQDESVEHEMDTSRLAQIQPGDTIRVKKSLFWDTLDVFGPVAGTAAIVSAAGR